jgi:hypothetical protein
MDPRFNIEFPLAVPLDLLKEFEKKPRVVIRWPFIVGIPVPDILMKKEFLTKLRTAGFDVMIVPKNIVK